MPLRQVQDASATRARSATAAASRSPRPRCAASAWATSSWPRPVSHIWYFKGIPSRMGLLLDIIPAHAGEGALLRRLYRHRPRRSRRWRSSQLLSEKEYRDMREKYEDDFDAGMGAEAIKELLARDRPARSSPSELHERAGDRRRPEEAPSCSSAWRWWRRSACSGNQPRVDDPGRPAGHPARASAPWSSSTAAASPPAT